MKKASWLANFHVVTPKCVILGQSTKWSDGTRAKGEVDCYYHSNLTGGEWLLFWMYVVHISLFMPGSWHRGLAKFHVASSKFLGLDGHMAAEAKGGG